MVLRPMTLSALCGLAWGLLGYWLARDTNMAHGAWLGLLASPVIGLLIGAGATRARPHDRLRQALFALLQMYLAVALFAAAAGAGAIARGWPSPVLAGGRFMAWLDSVGAALAAFTMSGWVVWLWPLSIANHILIWRRPGFARAGPR